jgi:hypothetical protein
VGLALQLEGVFAQGGSHVGHALRGGGVLALALFDFVFALALGGLALGLLDAFLVADLEPLPLLDLLVSTAPLTVPSPVRSRT